MTVVGEPWHRHDSDMTLFTLFWHCFDTFSFHFGARASLDMTLFRLAGQEWCLGANLLDRTPARTTPYMTLFQGPTIVANDYQHD